MTVGQRMKERRKQIGMSAEQLAEYLNVSPSTIYRYENGDIEKIGIDKLEPIARAIQTTASYLMGWEDGSSSSLCSPDIAKDTVKFYPIGSVAAGYDKLAYEDYSNEPIEIPAHYLGHRPQSDYFVLTVHGNSMYPAFMNGDKVLVLKQTTLNRSGDIGVILYEGENATLKKVEYVEGEDWMKLIPINPEYAPKTIIGADLAECRVLGIPKLLIRAF